MSIQNISIENKESLDYNPIYKVNHLVDGNIKSIYVFYGKNIAPKDQKELFNQIFTDSEMDNISKNNTTIHFSEQQIHYDDSIGIIKLKILNALKNTVSLGEIYLFCQKMDLLNPISVFQSLTQNKKIDLTKIRLEQFISNIIDETITIPEEKDIYDYDDILSMKLDNKIAVNKVLGQKFFIIENEYPFVCNPFKVTGYDKLFERSARKSISTLNSHLLLNTGQIINNNIFLCLANDVLSYALKNNISEENTIKIYYPFLYKKNINSLENLQEKEHELLEENNNFLNEKTLDNFKTVDMFYDIFKNKKSELNYVTKGIKYIKAVLTPDFLVKIPLEVIFKVIHATEHNPLIKYNPSSRQENIYRLYTDKISNDGRKIPYLKKGDIFKLVKNIGKTKSVTVLIENLTNTNTQSILCEFDENGFITISSEFDKVVDEKSIDNLFKSAVNPIINEIKTFLEQSGYKLNLFNSLNDHNVEVKQLFYESQIKISKQIILDSYKGCISSIFNNESSEFREGIHLRFKRVSNFNKVTSQEAFILQKQEEGYRGEEIIEALLDNFPDDLTHEKALDLVKKVANETQVERGVKKTNIKIKDNPGFKTTLTLEKKTGIVTITVENINDINYLLTIPIYLDTIIRLTQDKTSTTYPVKLINKLCSTGEKEDIKIIDIISPAESVISELEIASIKDDSEIDYKLSSKSIESEHDENKPRNALDLFFGNEDEDEDEDEEHGGAKNTGSSSEESIPSIKSESSIKSEPSVKSESISSSIPSVKSEEKEVASIPSVNSDKTPDRIESDNEEDDEEGDIEPSPQKEHENEELKNIDGLSLRNYFQDRIEEYDKPLIIKKKVGNYSTYSKICQSHHKRQPVILTDEQLEKINKEHKGFLRDEDVIKYGSDKNNQFNYICPRYWCLKTNTPIDPNEFKEVNENGKKVLVHPTCGKILPEGEDEVKPGHYVYEFYKPTADKPNYKRYPGFQPDKHPKGYCLPCCFDKYNTQGRIQANEKCTAKEDNQGQKEKTEKLPKKEAKEEQDEYIKGPEKFPLLAGRWGYLPVAIQKILHEVNAECQISKTNTNIKPNHPCLLRHGVEISEKQSFVACISDAKFFGTKFVSIHEMRQRIIKSLTIDNFIKYQNGNLVTDFFDQNKEINMDTLDEKYKIAKLYSKLNMSVESDKLFYKKVISAFENFINFLEDDEAVIDYTYLWDIICKPNKYLFESGINLVIFEIPNDDITNNVQMICPSNHYSIEFYEARKPTLFLMKEGNYYEPLYSYTINNNKISVAKVFSEYDSQLSKTIKAVLKEIVRPFFDATCKPLKSMPPGGLPAPSIYLAKTPLLLYNLVQKLDKYNYKILKLVVNFNNKVIGVHAESPLKQTGFVPCYPSAIEDNLKQDLDYVFMTDLGIWNTYNNTINFLKTLEKRSKKKRQESDIPCKPAFKIVEDELVVGILTETDQFIQLSEPISEHEIAPEYNIPSFKNSNYIVNKESRPMIQSDVPITTSNEVDEERVDYIKKIKLETNFYNVFRNTIRILLNDYENVKIRQMIELEMTKDYVIYSQKLKNMNNLLKQLVDDKIQFIGDENYYKLINEVSTCLVKDSKTCSATPNLCAITENGKCKLILPEKNLITHKNNEPMYFGKMADELIRYNRINSFMLQPQAYLSFGNIGYNLRDNEIILIQSLLTQEYFENIVPVINNKYVKYNSYDEAKPIISQPYDNVIPSLDNAIGRNNETECKITDKKKISAGIWNICFPPNYKEIQYNKTNYCTILFMIDLIERKTNEKLTVNKLKNVLYEEYKLYLEKYKAKIVDILIIEGKQTLGDQVRSEQLSFINFIYTDNYFFTTFDIWLLVQKYKIPTFFISSKFLLQTDYTKHIFLGYGSESDDFVFIVIPGLRSENIPALKIIESNTQDIFISLDKITSEECSEKFFDALRNKFTIEEYLEGFTKNIKTKYAKKKPLLIIEDSDEERVVQEEKKKKKETKKKKLLIIEDSSPISQEEIQINEKPKTKKNKKQYVIKGKTKKQNVKKKLIIQDSSTPSPLSPS